jgi:hypothetical protein
MGALSVRLSRNRFHGDLDLEPPSNVAWLNFIVGLASVVAAVIAVVEFLY